MKRWLKYAKPYWFCFILGPILMIVESTGEVVLPKLFAQIINNGVMQQNRAYIIEMGLLMLLCAVLMMAGGVGGCYFAARGSISLGTDVRSDVYDKIQKFSFASIDKFSTGSLVTRLTNDITQIQNFTNMLMRMCMRAPIMMIGAIIMAVRLNARLAIVLLVVMPIMTVLMVWMLSHVGPRFQAVQSKVDNLNTKVQENLTNVRVVKSFVREDYENEKFEKANADLKNAGLYALNLIIIASPLMMFFMNFTSLAVIWFGGRMVMVGTMPLGDLTAFITYISQILMSLMMLSMIFINGSRASASSKRLKEVLDEKLDLTDDKAAHPDLTVTKGKIEFKNVSFRYYKNSPEKVLDNIDLTIQPGSVVGIIGSTGCGKTTLVSMIPRLYDADEGQVLVDDVDVKEYSLYNLREGVGMVLQQNLLFSGTIEDNLHWGDKNASQEQIEEACKSAQAAEFIKDFSDGYQMELGQGGVNVSGGQKQRLCIARALLKHPKILILDDSTSAVDTATEARIREAFSKELKDSTKIIIAQRIGSVKDADTIVVMNDGKITGVGTHEELLKNNQEYQEIYYSQMDKKEAI